MALIVLHLNSRLGSVDDESEEDLPEDWQFWYDPPDNRTFVDSLLQYHEAFSGTL